MRIYDIRTLGGPNVYHHKPMLLMELDLEDLASTTTAEHPRFIERLLQLLPGLQEHHCSLGRPGGFMERMMEGTYFGHVVEHVAIELESMMGSNATHGKTRAAGRHGVYNVAVRFRSEHGMAYLLRQAVDLVEHLLGGRQFDVEPVLQRYRTISADKDMGPSTAAIVKAAQNRGIPWRRLDDGNLLQLGYGKRRRLVEAAVTDRTSIIAVDTVGDKARTKSVLHEAGVPVPYGGAARSLEEALELFREIGATVVVKPLDGNKGKDITLGVTSEDELKAAFEKAVSRCGVVVIEEEMKGRDYRLLVVNGRMVAASERRPSTVRGDGKRTISELIDELNEDPLRGEDHELPLTKVKKNDALREFLGRSGLNLESVPEQGESVVLTANANLSAGATAVDVTDVVHPATQRVGERAAALVGLDICGVDLVTSDISQPLDGGILELNASPGLRMHVAPSEGQPRDVGGAIVDGLFPPGTQSRIPLCAITGTNGKTTVARLVGHLAGVCGKKVGLTSTDGIQIGADLVRKGDLTGAASARSVLSDPTVEVAVLETARGGILRRGLGFDWADVGVITNVSADHLGQDGLESVEDLLWIKSLVAERVKDGGVLVLNAEDEGSLKVRDLERVDVSRLQLVLFAEDPSSAPLAAHLYGGGRGYFVRDGWIVEMENGLEHSLVRVVDVPLTMKGHARFQVQNVLAAAGAARALGATREEVATGLTTFRSHQNSGRGNVYAHGRGYVFVDYGHNEAAVRAAGQLLAGWNGPLTGIVGVPGDRSDDLIRNLGRAAGAAFPHVVLREDDDLRGRQPGEVARMMREAIEASAPATRVDIEPSARQALERLLDQVAEGALVAIFYEKLEEIVELLGSVGALQVDSIPLESASVAPSRFTRSGSLASWKNQAGPG